MSNIKLDAVAPAADGKPKSKIVKQYMEEIADARKREKNWRKDAVDAVKIYEGEKTEECPFNILYSNTETLAPALYNQLPRPVVQRRHKDEDPLGAIASKLTQRTLAFLIDANDQDYSNFDDMAKSAVLEALVPGRGITRFKYDATFEEVEEAPAQEELPGMEERPAHEAGERVSYETVCGEEVPWDRFLHGYAKKWKDVPWIAFEHFMSKEELVKTLGAEKAKLVPLNATLKTNSEDQETSPQLDNTEGVKLGHLYEIWEKDTRRILFISPAVSDVLKEVEDPLNLSGFYPIPRPLAFFARVSGLTPQTLYELYKAQARELNSITVRIKFIIKALKVRGLYDATVEGLDLLMESEDNTILPASNLVALQQGQTLEKSIWFMPLTELITVLEQLYLQRQQIKAVIYEINGIGDILRGASAASESATASNLKDKWGTLRLKKMQKEVMRYIRDCLRIMAEIALTKLSHETLAGMSGMKLPTAEQKAQAQAMAQQMMLQAQQQAAMIGQPPAPPALPPQLQTILASPTWEDVLGSLQSDIQRNYRIDIETNSTVDAEATEDKENMGEFLNALAQFLNGVGPMVEQGIIPFDVAKSILLAVTRRYRFGIEVEDDIKKMTAPPPKDPNAGDGGAAAAKGAAAQAEAQATIQAVQAKAQSQAAVDAANRDLAIKKAQAEVEQLTIDQQLRAMEAESKMTAMKQASELAANKHAVQMATLAHKAELLRNTPTKPATAAQGAQ